MSTSVSGSTTARAPGAAIVGSGNQVAPGAAALIATTGPLPAGTYDLEASLGSSGVLAAGKHVVVEHRNAGDSGVIQTYALAPAGTALTIFLSRIPVALNERFRVVTGAVAFAATEGVQGLVRATILP